jgi:hypothetical protein
MHGGTHAHHQCGMQCSLARDEHSSPTPPSPSLASSVPSRWAPAFSLAPHVPSSHCHYAILFSPHPRAPQVHISVPCLALYYFCSSEVCSLIGICSLRGIGSVSVWFRSPPRWHCVRHGIVLSPCCVNWWPSLVLRPLHCNRYCAGFPNESWFSFWVFGFLSVKVGVVQAH